MRAHHSPALTHSLTLWLYIYTHTHTVAVTGIYLGTTTACFEEHNGAMGCPNFHIPNLVLHTPFCFRLPTKLPSSLSWIELVHILLKCRVENIFLICKTAPVIPSLSTVCFSPPWDGLLMGGTLSLPTAVGRGP